LYDAAGGYDIGYRDPVDFSPFYFLEEAAHSNRSGFVPIIAQRRKYRHENEECCSFHMVAFALRNFLTYFARMAVFGSENGSGR
jgi:hypothetical protein